MTTTVMSGPPSVVPFTYNVVLEPNGFPYLYVAYLEISGSQALATNSSLGGAGDEWRYVHEDGGGSVFSGGFNLTIDGSLYLTVNVESGGGSGT
jgi:hypothetical protein